HFADKLRLLHLARLGRIPFPDTHLPIEARGGQAQAAGTKCQAHRAVDVSTERVYVPAGLRVQGFDVILCRPSKKVQTGRTEGHPVRAQFTGWVRENFLERHHFPDLHDRPVRSSTDGGQMLAVRAERYLEDIPEVCEGADGRAARPVPEPHGAVM